MQKLDILVLAAHPDDAELGCAGTIAAHVALGQQVGIVDFTRGELGTRGSAKLRAEEAEASRQVLGVTVRENLGFADGGFVNDRQHQLEIIKMIRRFQPDAVLANAIHDRHPDHGRGAELARDACFYSGLRKIETTWQGEQQMAWRPAKVFHFIQAHHITPSFVVDISPYWETKIKAIRSFASQFDSQGDEPQTYLTTPIFLKFIEARAQELGHAIGVAYGEGFTADHMLGVKRLDQWA